MTINNSRIYPARANCGWAHPGSRIVADKVDFILNAQNKIDVEESNEIKEFSDEILNSEKTIDPRLAHNIPIFDHDLFDYL